MERGSGLTAEVAIVGGGPAGLACALVLGRARRKVVVVDAGEPGHFAADAVHGFLGQEGVPPRELRRRAWEQMAPFDVQLLEGRVVRGRGRDRGEEQAHEGDAATRFELELADGRVVHSQIVVLAGGMHYGLQPVEGFPELWGERLFHCPFCHGWEVRGRRVAVICPPTMAEHYAGMFRLWTDDVQVLSPWDPQAEPHELAIEHEAVPLPVAEAEEERIADEGATPAPVPMVRRVRRDGDEVVIETDRGERRADALFAPPLLGAVDDLPEQLGLERYASSAMTTEAIGVQSDEYGATAVPGLYAAGDLTTDTNAVAVAVASGSRVGFAVARFFAARRFEPNGAGGTTPPREPDESGVAGA